MTRTRNEPGTEWKAALVHLVYASEAALAALFLGGFRRDLETAAIEMGWTSEFPIVAAAVVAAAAVATGFLAAALRRTSRWVTALRHRRMLDDPERAALVPPLQPHLQSRSQGLFARARTDILLGLFLLGVLAVWWRMWQDEAEQSGAGDLFYGAVLTLLLLVAIAAFASSVTRVRRGVTARRVERMSRDRARQREVRREEGRELEARIPRLVTLSPTLPQVSYKNLRPVSAERNVFGRPPWNIAYLRLFDNEQGLERFLHGPWRECGYVHLIRGASSVGHEELCELQGGTRMFINSRAALIAELTAQRREPLPPGDREFDNLGPQTVKVKDHFGSYPVCSLLCHDSFWKVAVDVLLERADVVVIDLAGYHWDNVGTGYELQRVIDRFPIRCCVVLAEQHHSDRRFLEAQIQSAWRRMAAGSPNAGEHTREVLVVHPALIVPWEVMQQGRSRPLALLVQQQLEATG